MDRRIANTLRILAIVGTALVVIAVCGVMLNVAFFVVMKGALTRQTRILHPQGANFVFGAILATITLVTVGVTVIVRLAKGIVRRPARSEIPAAANPPTVPAVAAPRSPVLSQRSLHPPLSPVVHKAIDGLVLAVVAQIAVSAITLFQLLNRADVPHSWTVMLLPPFLLSEVPSAILIYVLLKRPGRGAFTFLIAMLIVPILKTLFNPMLINSYRHIYMNHAMGIVLSGLIYIVTLVLAYVAIQQSGLWPKFSSATLATTTTFFYFFLIEAITPFLHRLWR